MSEEGSGATNLGFSLAGLGMGAIAALLLALKSGKEARE
jgi:gas vesicle protein